MMKVKLMWCDCQASYIHTQRDLLLACQGQNLIFQYEGVLVEHKITDRLRQTTACKDSGCTDGSHAWEIFHKVESRGRMEAKARVVKKVHENVCRIFSKHTLNKEFYQRLDTPMSHRCPM